MCDCLTRGIPQTWLSREELCHELAAAHVLLAEYGFTDTVWNHCSARLRPDSTDYLVTPFPYLFGGCPHDLRRAALLPVLVAQRDGGLTVRVPQTR